MSNENEDKEESRIPIWVYILIGGGMIALALLGKSLGDADEGAAEVGALETVTVETLP